MYICKVLLIFVVLFSDFGNYLQTLQVNFFYRITNCCLECIISNHAGLEQKFGILDRLLEFLLEN